MPSVVEQIPEPRAEHDEDAREEGSFNAHLGRALAEDLVLERALPLLAAEVADGDARRALLPRRRVETTVYLHKAPVS